MRFIGNIQFNTVTIAGGAVVYQATFGNSFTVLPKVGLAWTGLDHQPMQLNAAYGWESAISAITQGGASFTITPKFNFNFLKFRYIATQGDRLQVFFLSTQNTQRDYPLVMVPFNYTELVAFDSSNLPTEVFVGILLAGFEATVTQNQFMVSLGPGAAPYGQIGMVVDPQKYVDLYGPENNTFLDNGNAQVYVLVTETTNTWFTLFLHRINPPSEAVRTNGFYIEMFFDSVDGIMVKNTDSVTYNNLVVGAGQGLAKIFGFTNLWFINSTTNVRQSVDCNSSHECTLSCSGYPLNFIKMVALFYTVSCDASCVTCDGQFSNNCLSCQAGTSLASGYCCPFGCSACSSITVCTTCSQGSYRIATPNANNRCSCLRGYYENANGICVPCTFSHYCETCELSLGNLVCLSCKCANHREIVSNGVCACIAGYQENVDSPGPYCQKTITP